ncbi:MAG: acyltransferase [Candidatus Curtissbacteria bacterium]
MERDVEIDILKAFAIIGVILIHITSNSFALYPEGPAWYNLVILDQVMRFSVPLFVALSGYTLAARYLRSEISIKDFYLRRASKILPYYLAATAIIYLYLHLVPPWSHHLKDYPLWQMILLGKTDYHLYFIPMIFQLYLAFPLIIKAFKKWPIPTIAAAFVVQSLVFVITNLSAKQIISLPFAWGDQQQYLLSLTWMFYFVLGISLANLSNLPTAKLNLIKILGVVLAALGLTFTLRESFQILSNHQDLIEATRFTRYPILVYATGIIIASVLFAKNLLGLPSVAIQLLGKVGLISFSIYLLHTIAIRMVILNLDIATRRNFTIFAGTTIIASFILAWIFEEILKVARRLR